MRCSNVRSIRGGESNGGKRIDSGLDERGGEWLIHSLDWDSGEMRHADDEGGVRGIHIGAFGDSDDEVNNDGMARAVGMASNGQRLATCHSRSHRLPLPAVVRPGVCGGVDDRDGAD